MSIGFHDVRFTDNTRQTDEPNECLIRLCRPDTPKEMPLFTQLLTFLGIRKREVNVLVVGLDNSGKTTVMNHFKPSSLKVQEIVPTVGFNVEKFDLKNLKITAFDMSGQGRYRSLWEHYYRGVEGIVYVIDSSDSLRMVVAKDELETMLKHADLQGKMIPILFLANKIDLPDSMSASRIAQVLGLDTLSNPWSIQGSNAVTGEGLEEGISWLSEQLMRRHQK